MILSPHFILEEFLQSQAAARAGMALDPPVYAVDNLRRLCVSLLEPLRLTLGKAINISSGYRNTWLNGVIGGAPKSAHMEGRAADINVRDMPPVELAKYIRNHALSVDKCILEFPDSAGGGWVHVQVSPDSTTRARRQYLTAQVVQGTTVYRPGLMEA